MDTSMQVNHQRQEHTASYYAASANASANYPSLSSNETADVCIVGAGFTGIATALTLAERGYRVVVLEANRVGWGASGRNGGQLINGVGGLSKIEKRHGSSVEDLVWDMRWRGNDIIRERVEKYAIDCDLKDGYAEVAVKPSQIEYINEAAEERERRNFQHRFEVWEQQETAERLGTNAFHGAFVCYRDGHLHPLNLCIGEADAAVRQGTRIFEQSPAIDIERGERPKVRTERGSVTADAVVIAGNAYSQLEPAKLSNLVFPAGSYIIATEPLPEDIATEINSADVAVCDLNEVVDYYRLSADRRLLYGGACNYSGRDPHDIEAYIRPRMLRVYPQLSEVRVDYQWGGKIGIVLNRSVTVGRLHGDVYYCQGYSGHG
ncbi:MAG: FAD-binding oxidoreductase, partial [Pseudomonadota bacterium]